MDLGGSKDEKIKKMKISTVNLKGQSEQQLQSGAEEYVNFVLFRLVFNSLVRELDL